MEAMRQRVQVLADRIDAMSVRERGLIFFAVMVVLYLIANNVVFGPLRAEQAGLEQEINVKREQARNFENQTGALVTGEGHDVNGQNRAKLAALTQQLEELDMRVGRMTDGVVTPQEMAKLIEQVLARSKNLELVKLEALAPMPVEEEPGRAGATKSADATMYRHGTRVVLKGRYFDIVEYLKALESLPWKVFWGEVSLEADKYPVSQVTLVVYTLSRYSGWIGV